MPIPVGLFQIPGVSPIVPPKPVGEAAPAAAGEEFGSVFADAIHRVDNYRVEAEASTDRFLRGEDEEVHQVVLAGQRADVAFETFLGVRNKVVQAYQDVMRMQL